MMKYRSRFEIASSILHVAMGGSAKKTRLMYGSFLSFAQINEYLNFLLTNGLIKKNEDSHTYTLTEKGMQFLRVYEDLVELVPLEEPVPVLPEAEAETHTHVHAERHELLAHA